MGSNFETVPTTQGRLPSYTATQLALHRSQATELEAMLGHLQLTPGDRVIDVGCGDGAFTLWLARRVAPDGTAVGLDLDRAQLDLAGQLKEEVGGQEAEAARFVRGDVAALPFEDASFEAAWCAQSLYSLPDPKQALAEMRRVVRPGGLVGILENDTLHHVLLPWPPELELALKNAEKAALERTTRKADQYYVGRELRALFLEVGFERAEVLSESVTRNAPLASADRRFLQSYLDSLQQRVHKELSRLDAARLEALVDPMSSEHLLSQASFSATVLYLVGLGQA